MNNIFGKFFSIKKAKRFFREGRYIEAYDLLTHNNSSSALSLINKLKEKQTLEILKNLEKMKEENTARRPNRLEECQTLNDFALFFDTDKSSELHDVCDIYEEFLKDFKGKEFNLFEFGVLQFASVNMWGAYFPEAHIFGIDPGQQEYVTNINSENITYIQHDAYDQKFMDDIFKKYPPSVILDDATHYYSHQILGFEQYFPFLNSGGLYIVEDMETSFGDFRYGIWNDQKTDAASYFIQMALLVNGRFGKNSHTLLNTITDRQIYICQSINRIIFIKNSVIVVKK